MYPTFVQPAFVFGTYGGGLEDERPSAAKWESPTPIPLPVCRAPACCYCVR